MQDKTEPNAAPTDAQPLLDKPKPEEKEGPIDFGKRVSVIDDDYAGQKMPTRLAKGPVSKRGITDVICCICFAIFVVVFVVLGIIYAARGNVSAMLEVMDSEGNICGVEEKVIAHKYLYFFKFDADYKSVCVKECPKFDYAQIKANASGLTTGPAPEPIYFEDLSKAYDAKWTKPSPPYEMKNRFDFDEDVAKNLYDRGMWSQYVKRFDIKCVPNSDIGDSCLWNDDKAIYVYDSRPSKLMICLPVDSKLYEQAADILNQSKGMMDNLLTAKWMIVISIFTALIMSLVFLFLSNLLMAVIVWLQLGIALVFCAALAIFFFVLAFTDQTATLKENGASLKYIESYQNLKKHKWWFFTFGLFLTILATALIVYIAFKYKKINSNVQVLKFGNNRLIKNSVLLLLAIVIFVFQLLVFLFGLFVASCIYSTGTLVRDTKVGSPFKSFSMGVFAWCLVIFVQVGTLWFFIFFNNLGDYISSAVVCEEYFKSKGGFFGALCNTLLYHIGSVAFASVVLLPCSLVQFIYGPIYDLISKSAVEGGVPNKFQIIASYACICLKWPYKKWIMRTGEQGFPMGYLASCNFCPASKEAFYLLEGYSETLGDVGLITFLYRLTGVLAITFLNTFIAFLVLTKLKYYQNNLQSPVGVLVVIFLVSLVIATLFMNTLGTVTEAALICYLIQLDVGVTPTDPTLNQFMLDLANKDKHNEMQTAFEKAGGRVMGSKYTYDNGY